MLVSHDKSSSSAEKENMENESSSTAENQPIHFDMTQAAQMVDVKEKIATNLWNDYSGSRRLSI